MAAAGAVFLCLVGCTAPPTGNGKSGNNHDISLASPSPTASPSPSPTQQFAANSPAFHGGEVGVAYSPVALTGTGGATPYHWTVSRGALPTGLTIGSDGSVSGTPTQAGKFAFSIDGTDSGTGKATITSAISIAAALTVTLLPACAKACNVELGCTTACGSFATQAGGAGPFKYNQTSGQLPAGTSLSALSLTGTFTGQTGFLQFTVQVTDSLGGTASVSPTFWMYPHIVLSGGPIPSSPNGNCPYLGYDPTYGPGCRAQFPYSGGTPNAGTPSHSAAWVSYSWSSPSLAACTNPPPMPVVAVGNGVVTVTVPQAGGCGSSGYTGTLAITLTNQDLCSAGPVKCSASAKVAIRQTSG